MQYKFKRKFCRKTNPNNKLIYMLFHHSQVHNFLIRMKQSSTNSESNVWVVKNCILFIERYMFMKIMCVEERLWEGAIRESNGSIGSGGDRVFRARLLRLSRRLGLCFHYFFEILFILSCTSLDWVLTSPNQGQKRALLLYILRKRTELGLKKSSQHPFC